MPVAHIAIVWVTANVVLSIVHSPKIVMGIMLEMSYLFGIGSFLVCLFIANKILKSREEMKKLQLNFDSKISLW